MKKMLTLLLCGMTLTMSGNIEGMKKFGRGGYSPKKQSTRPVEPPKAQKNISQDCTGFPTNYTSSGSDSDSTSSETPSFLAEGWRTKTVCTKSSQEFINLQQDIGKAQRELERLKKQYEDQKSVNEKLLKKQSEKEIKAEDDKKSIDAEYDTLSRDAEELETTLKLLDKEIQEKQSVKEEKVSLKNVSEKKVFLAHAKLKIDKTVILSIYVDNLNKANSLIEKNGSKCKVNPNIDNFIRSLEEENTELRQKLEKFKEKDKKAIAEIQKGIEALDKDKDTIELSVKREIEEYDRRIEKNKAEIEQMSRQISSDGEFYSFLSKMTTLLDKEYCCDSNGLSQNVQKQNAIIRDSLKLTEEAGEKNIKEHISFLQGEVELLNEQKIEILTQQKQLLENIKLLKQPLVEKIEQHKQNIARFSLPGKTE